MVARSKQPTQVDELRQRVEFTEGVWREAVRYLEKVKRRRKQRPSQIAEAEASVKKWEQAMEAALDEEVDRYLEEEKALQERPPDNVVDKPET